MELIQIKCTTPAPSLCRCRCRCYFSLSFLAKTNPTLFTTFCRSGSTHASLHFISYILHRGISHDVEIPAGFVVEFQKLSLSKWGEVHNLSCENEFYLHENEKWFPHQRLSTNPRFETEARGNSEMAYSSIGTGDFVFTVEPKPLKATSLQRSLFFVPADKKSIHWLLFKTSLQRPLSSVPWPIFYFFQKNKKNCIFFKQRLPLKVKKKMKNKNNQTK